MSFRCAYNFTMGHEGGYANHPDDKGGETYKGIARVYWPQWEGWERVDALKPDDGAMAADEALQTAVESFYKANFWDPWWGDQVSAFSHECATEVFDTGVNMGVKHGVKFLQRALNLMNRAEHLFNDLTVDGIMGPNTLKGLELVVGEGDDSVAALWTWMNVLQGMRYIEIMERDDSQESFARGWSKRVLLRANQ